MPRRRVTGIGAIHQKNIQKNAFSEHGKQIQNERLSQMEERIVFFRTKLKEFASKYKKQIQANPEFRHHFHEMCLKIGVDPLASSKGFWSELLGVGDFYYELSVQIIELCYSSRAKNGGLMELQELKQKLESRRNKYSKEVKTISIHDIKESIEKIRSLGNGFCLLKIGNSEFVQSVPCELNSDHTTVLAMISERQGISNSSLAKDLAMSEDRLFSVIDALMNEGIVWVDEKGEERGYWVRGSWG